MDGCLHSHPPTHTIKQPQKDFYKSLLARHYPVLAGGGGAGVPKSLDTTGSKPTTALKNLCMELRKCCNHPYLFEGADPG